MGANLILADHTGRLGNKLILFAHVMAVAEELDCRVFNLSILPSAHYFEGLHLNPWGAFPRIFFPLDVRWLVRSLRKPLQDWIRGRHGKAPIRNRWLTVLDMENQPIYRLDSPEFAALTRQTKWIILWGYPFRCPALVKKHASKIRSFFKIRPQVAPIASREIAATKQFGKETLAIHVRQGDFRDWNGGKYYFSPLETFQTLFLGGWNLQDSRSRIWVCSDEEVPEDLFPPESTQGVPRTLGEDLFIMSRCQRLVGGWSTLAYFCSFLGNNEFYRVSKRNHAPERQDTNALDET